VESNAQAQGDGHGNEQNQSSSHRGSDTTGTGTVVEQSQQSSPSYVFSSSHVPIPGIPSQPKVPAQNLEGTYGAGSQTSNASSIGQLTGLPSSLDLCGPDLITRLQARETTFPFEELSRRLFRPPRCGKLSCVFCSAISSRAREKKCVEV
jgi:hypothetical protein